MKTIRVSRRQSDITFRVTLLFLCLTPLAASAEVTYLTAGSMIDTLDGSTVENPVVEIEDDKIKSVTSGGAIPGGATIIDLGDATIIPGLADVHAHLSWYATDNAFTFLTVSHSDEAIRSVVNSKVLLMAGFTTVRNTGAGGFSDVSTRNAINEGRVPGPRLQVSGPSLGITGGHCDENLLPKQYDMKQEGIADGPWAVRLKVRDNKKYGVDLIKFCATGGVLSKGTAVGARQFTMEEMEAIVDEAHIHGMKVAAHAHGAEGIVYAIRAGVDSIEHASLIDDEGIRLAKRNGTFLTMDIYSTEYILAEGENIGVLPESMEKAAYVHKLRNENFRNAVEAGAKVVFGTDSSVIPHGDNAIQFSRMVEHGMTPMQAIQSATTVAAELLNWEGQTGAIAPGYFADIIAVDGDPLEDISVLEEVFFVMKGGVVYKEPD